jgi:hypothetical protein
VTFPRHWLKPRSKLDGANITIIARRACLIFGDIEGKLDVLRVECTKCSRKGRYHVATLIEKHGRKANMMKWREMLSSDCPRRDAAGLSDRCDLICPDLPSALTNFWRGRPALATAKGVYS